MAQSSASHKMYLQRWVDDFKVPILSVDYSLSPDAKLGCSASQCLLAYCWARVNLPLFGLSPSASVYLVGDSAGGSLAMSVSVQCARYGLRGPDGVQSQYGVMNSTFALSPSRLLAVGDALLPSATLRSCIEAYSGLPWQETRNPANKDKLHFGLSPFHAPDHVLRKLPPVYLMASEMDPFLDDSVEVAARLHQLGNKVDFQVAAEVSHGFLQLVGAGKEVSAARELCCRQLGVMLDSGKTKQEKMLLDTHESFAPRGPSD